MKFTPTQLALGSLLCLAAAGASAQSNVKVYGLIDMSVGSFKNPGSTVSQTAVESNKMTTSFLGFGGSEDLGGGLSAVFALEGFFRGDTGAQGRFDASGTKPADAQFARNAYVGLSSKDYGTVTIGRNTTPLFVTTVNFNAFGGSFGFSPTVRHIFGANAAVTGDSGWSDSVVYNSPSFAGFKFGVAAAGKTYPSSGSNSDGSNWSANLGYSNGPLAATLLVQEVKKDIAAGTVNESSLDDTKTTQVGVSYNFGVAKVFALYTDIDNDTTVVKSSKLTDLGVSVPLGTGSLIAQYGKSDYEGAAVPDVTTTSIGYVYPLSKKTDLYAVGMQDKKEGLSTGHSYAVGMRLKF